MATLPLTSLGEGPSLLLLASGGSWLLWTQCPPTPVHVVDSLTPNVMVLGGGASGKSLGLDEDRKGAGSP